ncbi:MAG: MarC family protein [Actinomycetaceae bacterium]|nr:MarC family protein [Arcanobacterium sp.]MDD7504358.1 MarC family protein [Actinomycetaceae bacterium]
MSFDLALFGSAFATLFVIIDPFGNLPVFMSLTAHYDRRTRRRVAIEANVIALALLLIFGFFGFALFDAMGITPEALQISGGLLLLLVALQLLTGKEEDPGARGAALQVAAVPLGMPLLAGPGSIVAFMLFVQRANGKPLLVLAACLALVCVLGVSMVAMYFATPIMRMLGTSGVMLLTRLSGMLLAAIATQLMITGVITVIQSV